MAFAAAFLAAAAVVFALAFFLGTLLQVSNVSVEWRRGIAAGGLITLALFDVLAIRMGTYCPLGWRRQTPKSVMLRKTAVVTTTIWGFDTGLAVTTSRVAAITWGAFILAFLGLTSWKIGIGYGVGFVLPLMVILWTNRVVEWPFLAKLLKQRPVLQVGSAALLTAGSLILLLQPFP